MSAKIFLIILAGVMALLISSAIVVNILESSGKLSRETIGPGGVSAIQIFFFSLFIIICFTVVPLFIKLFLYMQIKIGHGELAVIKWLQANETHVIYGLWIFMLIGFCIALQGAIKDGLFK